MPRRLDHKRTAQAFGRLLRKRRMELGLTQYELAHQSGIDISFLSRMERGLTQPSIGTFLQLASAVDVSPVEWIGHLVRLDGKQ